MSDPTDQDFTAQSGGPTDVAPLGRTGPKPAHERTADEDINVANWNTIASSAEFAALLQAKRRFITKATVFFLVYYLALPVLVGFWPDIMRQPVIGKMNWAYLFALSQFFMAWILAALYTRAAAHWDKKNADLLTKLARR
jgi:uncharacterized membrane protein (DUF485 family)